MIRKLLLVAAAVAMPVGAATATLAGTSRVAGATPPIINCHVGGTVMFANEATGAGLSKVGSTTTATTVTTSIGTVIFTKGTTVCTGSSFPQHIKTATVRCTGAGMPTSNPACKAPPPQLYGYDSWKNYTSTATSSILKSIPNITFTVNGTTYTTHTLSVATLFPTSAGCGTGTTGLGKEAGFQVNGKVTTLGTYDNQATTLKVCLGRVTGANLVPAAPPATVPTFYYQINNASNLVKTSTLDPLHSSFNIT